LSVLLFLIAGSIASATLPERGKPEANRLEELPMELAQVTIEQRVIIRVPMVPPGGPPPRSKGFSEGSPPPPLPMEWKEHKGPKCVPIRGIAKAAIRTDGGVDLVMRGRTLLRAKVARECRAVDLYAGFYIQPTADGNLCAKRDAFLARSGMSCEIQAFRKLEPKHH
jgi:hypothetical protein